MPYELTEPGKYTGTFVSIEVGKSPNTGTPCVATVWRIEELDIERTVYTYINKNTKKISFKKLEAMGFNGDFKAPAIDVEQIELRCVHSTYTDDNDEEQTNEKWDLASWGGAAVESADARTLSSLNQQWKKREKGADGDAAKPKAAAPKKKGAAKKGKTAPPPEPAPEPEPEDDASDDDSPSDGKTPRELAWASFLEHKASEEAIEDIENGKSATAAMEWSALIAEVIPDKDEGEFTASDWKEIKEHCEIPWA